MKNVVNVEFAFAEIPSNETNNGEPDVTVRSRNGNTYVIQSMADGSMPEGIRINSMEATILTPADDIAAALTGGELIFLRLLVCISAINCWLNELNKYFL